MLRKDLAKNYRAERLFTELASLGNKTPLRRENNVFNFDMAVDLKASQSANASAGAGFARPR